MTPATRPKRRIRRPVSNRERMLSAGIIIILIFIGAAVAVKGRHYDPARFALDASKLKSTTEAIDLPEKIKMDEPDAPPSAESGDHYESMESYGESHDDYESQTSSAAQPAQTGALDISTPGLTPMGPTEVYNTGTLYEKINGRAPAYQAFDFQMLRSQTFSLMENPGAFIDLYEYDMGEPRNAFGIFALERDPNGAAIDWAGDGYRSEMGYFFRQGKIYAQVIASDAGEATMTKAQALARERAGAIEADDAGLEGLRRLPPGMAEGSMAYTAANAMGQSKLNGVYQAKYATEMGEVTFFVMAAPDETAASAAYEEFLQFHRDFGTVAGEKEQDGAQVFIGENFGLWAVAFVRGSLAGGVVECETREAAEAFVSKYLMETKP